ncbi:unnamed protein product [Anisakis simplex]|uniref:Tumor necrosis factor alpha-induced protein 8-like protein n=1 Tax=Anisakis simplex TaxID=6269 RepID=A0A0M3JVH3_ANISI|nr:unnamed protein product [Anisakis simplex]
MVLCDSIIIILSHNTILRTLFSRDRSEENSTVSNGVFKSATIVQRAQKKVLSKVVSRGVIKHFVSDAATRIFDGLYMLLSAYYNKVTAEKVVKNIIKLVVKLGVVVRGGNFGIEEENELNSVQKQMHQLCLTLISFGKVAYSYDRNYLVSMLNETHMKINRLVVKSLLSDKSRKRLDMVFEHISKENLLDRLFRVDGEYTTLLASLVNDLETLIDSKDL